MIQSIITKAHEHNMTVTVTGINKKQQINYLQKLGCEFGQGDWITKLINPELIFLE